MSFTISLAQVEEALRRAKQEEVEAHKRVEALSKIAEGLRDLNGHASEFLDPPALPLFLVAEQVKQPRGREAVRRIVADRPGLWKLADIRAEMQRRDWFTSAKGVEVAVRRLCESGEAERTSKKGVYRFPVPKSEEIAA